MSGATVVRLYERTDALEAVREWILEHDDEIRAMEGALPDELAALLAEAEKDFNAKVEGVALIIRELSGLAKFAEAEEDRLAARRKHYERGAAGLKEYLRLNMERVDVDKIEGKLVNVRLQKSPPSLKVAENFWTQETLSQLYALENAPPPEGTESQPFPHTVRHIPERYEFDARAVIELGTFEERDPANPKKTVKRYVAPLDGMSIEQSKHVRIQ